MKIYKVDGIHGSTLVRAKTKAGAIKLVAATVRQNATATIATQDEIYSAGARGVAIIDAAQDAGSEETTNG